MKRSILACVVLSSFPALMAAQGTLDRSPDVSGDWVLRPGTLQFNFLHRFMRSPKPARKVSSFPTFLLAGSFLKGTTVGFNYSTNSTLAAAYPNEWEFFARAQPLTQAGGAPVDLGGQVGYNLAARGADGELSVGRRMGPLHLIGVGRALSDPKRLCVLDSLTKGELSVRELSEVVGCQVPNMSQHLAVLRSAGLVSTRRVGSTVFYRVADPAVLEAYRLIRVIAR